jgi:hypothetical protein
MVLIIINENGYNDLIMERNPQAFIKSNQITSCNERAMLFIGLTFIVSRLHPTKEM